MRKCATTREQRDRFNIKKDADPTACVFFTPVHTIILFPAYRLAPKSVTMI